MFATSLLARASLVAALFTAHAAHADTVLLDSTGPGTAFGTFSKSVDGLFIDTYDFSPTSFAGLVSITLKGVSGGIGFFTATLNGTDFSYFPESGAVNFAFQANVTADVPLSLTVFGSTLDADGNVGGAGSYRGAVTTSVPTAVPEAQTWALLLAGLGLTGVAVGRSRRPVRCGPTARAA